MGRHDEIALRQGAEPHRISRITRYVNRKISMSAFPPRALRLKTEAGNCLAIAVGHADTAFAGELIDEALRLMRRAHELTQGAMGKN